MESNEETNLTKKCNNEEECVHLDRVIKLLKAQSNGSLIESFQQEHDSIVNDYIHIITKHQPLQQQTILHHDLKCDADKCQITQNQSQTSTSGNLPDNDEQYSFYRDLVYALHSYLLHPNITIKSRRNSRFHIIIQDRKETKIEKMHRFISNTAENGNDHVSSFQRFIDDEEYDSEAIVDDVGMDETTESNIALCVDETIATSIRKYIYLSKCMLKHGICLSSV